MGERGGGGGGEGDEFGGCGLVTSGEWLRESCFFGDDSRLYLAGEGGKGEG